MWHRIILLLITKGNWPYIELDEMSLLQDKGQCSNLSTIKCVANIKCEFISHWQNPEWTHNSTQYSYEVFWIRIRFLTVIFLVQPAPNMKTTLDSSARYTSRISRTIYYGSNIAQGGKGEMSWLINKWTVRNNFWMWINQQRKVQKSHMWSRQYFNIWK